MLLVSLLGLQNKNLNIGVCTKLQGTWIVITAEAGWLNLFTLPKLACVCVLWASQNLKNLSPNKLKNKTKYLPFEKGKKMAPF